MYVKQLADTTLNSHFDVIEKIVSYDEDFTYELLTTQKIMTVLENQEEKIHTLIKQFAPLLQFGIKLSSLSSIDNKS
jgi:hypothetical protein